MQTETLFMEDRLLIHLSKFDRFTNENDCPLEVTQKGTATALEISQSYTATIMKKQQIKGYVYFRMAYIRGHRQRRQVYFLTPFGQSRVAELLGSKL